MPSPYVRHREAASYLNIPTWRLSRQVFRRYLSPVRCFISLNKVVTGSICARRWRGVVYTLP